MDITNIDKTSKIAVYSRKSREEGEDTLENHRLRLSEFVTKNGFTNVNWYEEVVTGSSIDMRPKFLDLLEKVGKFIYSAVIVIDFDRLSRGDTYERGLIERAFKSSQTLIMMVNGEVLDYNNKSEALTANVKGLLANFELEQITMRLKEGKKLAVKKGLPHSGRTPFGYTWDRNIREVVINEEEYKVYKMMIKWYITDKLSYNAIANKLNDMGHKTRKGKLWYAKMISETLRHDFHLGYVAHGRIKSFPTDRRNEKGEIIWKHIKNPNHSEIIVATGNHEPIKSEEEHAMIMERSVEEKTKYSNKSLSSGGHGFNLKGLIRCEHCGLTRVIAPNGKNKTPYIKKCDRISNKRTDKCGDNMGINESVVYDVVINKLIEYRELLFKPDMDDSTDTVSNIENEITLLKTSIENSQKSIKKQKQMFEADIITIDELKSNVNKKEEDIIRLTSEIEKLSKSAEYVKKNKRKSSKEIWSSEMVSNLLKNKEVFSAKEINVILKSLILYITCSRIGDGTKLDISIMYR